MIAAARPEYFPLRSFDQRVLLHGVTWQQYETILSIRGEQGGVRVAYLAGGLELMSPSLEHERIEKTLARLLEAYAEECALELNGYGSWTVKDAAVERGAEPDECYVFGAQPEPERPVLAIEVVWTRGGIDKLELYRKLRVRELWLWESGRLHVYELAGERYEERERSVQLPELDLELLARHTAYVSQTQAVLAFRKALRAR